MKRIFPILLLTLALAGSLFGQARSGGQANALAYTEWTAKTTADVASGASKVVTLTPCLFQISQGNTILPILTSVPLTFNDANIETVTPSAVTGPATAVGGLPNTCTATVTLSNAHNAGTRVTTGDGGVGEAVADLKSGIVYLGPGWASATAIASIPGGNFNVSLEDRSTGAGTKYCWNGSGYAVCGGVLSTANGATLVPFTNSELLTLATGATTTDTTANLLPADSIILGVNGRVTTTITAACTGWALGISGAGTQFTASQTTLTAGTTSTGKASATAYPNQAAAAKVRVTCAGGNPGAGAIRITVFGYTFIPPTS